MRRYRRVRKRWGNVIGGIWVFAAEASVVVAALLLALAASALVLWVF